MTRFLIDCDNVENLPVINIVINGQVFPLHGEDYVYREDVLDKQRNLCRTALLQDDDYGLLLFLLIFANY